MGRFLFPLPEEALMIQCNDNKGTCTVPTTVIMNQNSRRKARFKRADSSCLPVIHAGQIIQETSSREKTRPRLQWQTVPQSENRSENLKQKPGRQAP